MFRLLKLVVVSSCLFGISACNTSSNKFSGTGYTIASEADGFGGFSISITPNTTKAENSKNSGKYIRLWHREAKLACNGSYSGNPIMRIFSESKEGIATVLQPKNTIRNPTRTPETIKKVHGTAFCPKISP